MSRARAGLLVALDRTLNSGPDRQLPDRHHRVEEERRYQCAALNMKAGSRMLDAVAARIRSLEARRRGSFAGEMRNTQSR